MPLAHAPRVGVYIYAKICLVDASERINSSMVGRINSEFSVRIFNVEAVLHHPYLFSLEAALQVRHTELAKDRKPLILDHLQCLSICSFSFFGNHTTCSR
jgi:hypothetical protein